MTDGDDGAFANSADNGYQAGLTKREYFAAMAMQGILANPTMVEASLKFKDSRGGIAATAVSFADLLITALNKEA